MKTWQSHKFLIFLNNQHLNIHFTIDIEEDGKLPFLDVLVSKKVDGILGHHVYRKPTHRDRYLYTESHHPAPKSLQYQAAPRPDKVDYKVHEMLAFQEWIWTRRKTAKRITFIIIIIVVI